MKPSRLSLSLALAAAFAVSSAHGADSAVKGKPQLGSFGVDLSAQDKSVKPGDDFNRYVSGHWLDTYQLKDYETTYGSFNILRDQSEAQVHAIIESLQKRKDLARGSDAQKLRDYYASYMDRAARDAAGIAPLQPVLDRIGAISSKAALIEVFGNSDLDSSAAPLRFNVELDRKDPDQYLVGLRVAGLGLPDRDYYLNQDARFVGIRAAYLAHIERMLGFAGVKDAKARAQAVLALETELAKPQWERAQLRDRDKTYNVATVAELAKQYPGYDWAAQAKAQGLPALNRVNVVTPSAVQPVIDVVARTPLPVWRDYLTFHAVRGNAPLLSREMDDAAFAFTGTVLGGQKAQRDDWKRAVAAVTGTDGLGDAMGKLYVEKNFSPQAKAAMQALVENLRTALRSNIEKIDWMGDATKAEAYRKLSTFRPKVGYPDKWRDYSSVTIVPGDLMANVMQMRRYGRDDQNRRIGTRPDRDEWFMTPQTVNAYYNSTFNEIVFPAAILQAPFFDLNADPAVNYGGIGAVIGHEMGHGFDDQGSKSDYAGVQRNWWTDADRAGFEQRTKALGAQYNAFCPLPGQCVNGALTMGENIGDLGGVSMAYTAYQLSLGGKPTPVIDGVSGDQRFFLSWGQVWKSKYRDEALLNLIKTNPHSPGQYRAYGPLRNFDPWYQAFDVKAGDKLYVAPDQRVRIW
ncbi:MULTISPECIES: M13 family metallopeptidase [unclassified Lysobacter]|uniref:M13 family metallopeptidase n=1 Tax=unclassified Lysobacter TaxID=2635362 RepID=UPI001BEC9B22|nr:MULTISPECIES: M13 family metallopeptidase [unclassified Lysobacter]MBT2746607.1 M13 family metallopeptidase [Lysobacter sp. ISL-42]MBT2753398.1 M13 family metallopeptidase [Lysobacter sp. ISL-50]MBT2775508.1 M13 family metallopeptidase [Lysobacter sp. ISL-54]MBT2782956.1 M13 family metallopeptidase [Lysobacter sp. ISL-52]